MLAAAFAPNPLAIAAEKLRAGQRAREGLEPPTFANPEQEAFFESTAPELLYSGWMGAGKSRILCEKAWHLGLRHPGAQLGIFRKVHKSLAATTERTFWRDVADPRYVAARNKTESWVEISAGGKPSRIYFLGLDPDPVTGVPSKVGSLDLAWAGVDEAVELTEADWIMLQGRLRDPAIDWHQLAAATNPAAPRHWLKRRFTPPTEQRQYLNASGNRFLGADYLARLADLGDGVVAQRLGKGLWVAAEGQIFQIPPDQIVHLEQTSWKRTVGGIDWGYQHAFAAEVVSVTGSGRLATRAEVYERERTLGELKPAIKRLQLDYGVEVFYADPSEPAYIRECREFGISITEATNDVLPGITAVQDALKAGMTVDPACAGLLEEADGYTWDRQRGTEILKDQPVKEGDDAMDAWRYAVMGALGGSGLLAHLQRELEARRAFGAAPS